MQSPVAWIQALSAFDLFLFLCALAGGTFFLIRMGFQFVGFGEVHGDLDGDGLADGHSDPDAGFRLLSIHGLSAFFMMFGLVGLAMHLQSSASPGLSVGVGALAGGASVELIRRLFRLFGAMQTSGNLSADDHIGCSGEVYLGVPANGTGQALVSVKGRRREIEIRHVEGAPLETGVGIVVLSREGNVFVVRPIR